MPAHSFARRAKSLGRTCGACAGWRGRPGDISRPRPDYSPVNLLLFLLVVAIVAVAYLLRRHGSGP